MRASDKLGQRGDGDMERPEDRSGGFEAVRLAALGVGEVLGEGFLQSEAEGRGMVSNA